SALSVLSRSTDGGGAWTVLDQFPPDSFNQIFAVVIAPSDPRTVYVNADFNLFRSTDGGDTWQKMSTQPGSIIAVPPQHPAALRTSSTPSWLASASNCPPTAAAVGHRPRSCRRARPAWRSIRATRPPSTLYPLCSAAPTAEPPGPASEGPP